MFINFYPLFEIIRTPPDYTKAMILRFFVCGIIGWCLEILWTGLHSLFVKDKTLMGKTSLWMFPIYGCACLLQPLYLMIGSMPLVVRGIFYMIIIFAAEFVSGWLLRDVLKACPWDYSQGRFSVYGLIRIDYAPGWFVAGLLFETVFIRLLQLGL